MAKLSDRLKELRYCNSVTQTALAKAIGISQNAVAEWENEKRVPNANAIIAIAKYFDVTTDFLLGLEKD